MVGMALKTAVQEDELEQKEAFGRVKDAVEEQVNTAEVC